MKKLILPFVLSLGIHGLGVMHSEFSPVPQEHLRIKKKEKDLVHFSYSPSEPLMKKSQSAQKAPDAKRTPKTSGLEARNLPAEKQNTQSGLFEHTADDKMMQRMRRLVKKQISQLKNSPTDTSTVKSSSEIFADPKTKKVFGAYLTKIRQKIQRVAQTESSKSSFHTTRSTTLQFVLSQDGSLQQIGSVLNQNLKTFTDTDIFAQSCLKLAAPFDPFPKEILFKKIAFNITLIFEE